jgi:hypothetical protein
MNAATPETDALLDRLNDDWDVEFAAVTNLAKRLERQRNAALFAEKSGAKTYSGERPCLPAAAMLAVAERIWRTRK